MTSSFKDILLEELKNAVDAGIVTTQAQFAKSIGLSAQHLSQIFRGRSGLSPEAAKRVAASTKMSAARRALFLKLVNCEHSRSPSIRRAFRKQLDSSNSQD